jgi:hypothetical protein
MFSTPALVGREEVIKLHLLEGVNTQVDVTQSEWSYDIGTSNQSRHVCLIVRAGDD